MTRRRSSGDWPTHGGSSSWPSVTTCIWSTTTLSGRLTSWRQSWFKTIVEIGSIMIDELKEEEIVNKVGGRFKLSTLIQKRMIALNQGARALVDSRGVDKMTLVIQEIMQDKIYLDMSGKLQTNEVTEEMEADGGTVDLTQSTE